MELAAYLNNNFELTETAILAEIEKQNKYEFDTKVAHVNEVSLKVPVVIQGELFIWNKYKNKYNDTYIINKYDGIKLIKNEYGITELCYTGHDLKQSMVFKFDHINDDGVKVYVGQPRNEAALNILKVSPLLYEAYSNESTYNSESEPEAEPTEDEFEVEESSENTADLFD